MRLWNWFFYILACIPCFQSLQRDAYLVPMSSDFPAATSGRENLSDIISAHSLTESSNPTNSKVAVPETNAFAEEPKDAESARNDLIGKLYNLVDKGTLQDKALSEELLKKQQETEDEIRFLESQRDKANKDALLLKRLQDCLDEGVAEDRLKQQHLQVKEEQAAFEKEKKALEEARSRTKELEAKLAQREAALATLQEKIKQAEMELSTKEERHQNQSSLLASREADIDKKASSLSKQIAALEAQSLKLEKQPPIPSYTPRRKNDDCDSGSSSCHACLQSEGCAWCRTPGRCLAHNVNAQENGEAEDGLVAGLCQPDQWSSALTSKLTILTLDVFGADNNNAKVRVKNILALLNKADADIVTFQEATTWLLEGLLDDSWTKKTYHITEFSKTHHVPGGLLILSRTPIYGVSYYEQVHPGQTQNDERGKLLLLQTKINESPITVATTTLDWRNAHTRVGSLDFIFSVIAPFEDVFLSGGFNFDDGAQPESNRIPPDYVDAWCNVYPNKTESPGFTWNPQLNEFAYQSDKHSEPSRIDKVFLRSTSWMVRTISLIGCSADDLLCQKKSSTSSSPPSFKTKPSRDLEALYVSNHYGLLAELSHFEPHCV